MKILIYGLFLGRQKPEENWQCIFLKIRFTNKENGQLEEIYEKKFTDLAIKNSEYFQLIAECKAIHHLDSVIDEIEME